MSDKYILELKNITKKFPGVKALDNVNFQLKAGEIHALMGENGAGKSTFIKVITGVHQPNEGEIYLNGEKIEINDPNDSKDLGIAAIYQHATSYPHLSVTENIFMGHEKIDSRSKRIMWGDMHQAAAKHLEELGADFEPRRRMSTLSVAQQQIVEIAKAISTKAEIIIMDEPTASLTKTESEDLYRITEKLQKIGTSIIFISHRFEDMYRLADRVTVLRDSKYIGTWGVNEVSNKDLIKAMVGREINQLFPKTEKEIGKEIMRVENLSRKGYFKDISFALNEGEILAVTGLVGAGRTELCESLFGIKEYDSGIIYFEDKEVKIKEVEDAMNLGIGYLPEDRQEQGLILDWELDKNISLSSLDKISKRGWIDRKKEKNMAKRLAEKVNVKARSIFNLASQLSGGNQQKIVVAKLLTSDLKVIILDEPTKGVDVGAKSAIFEIMSDLAAQGYAIIMVSSEMPEVLGMGDRILVMRNGEITAEMDVEEADQEKILEAAMKAEK
ncbi:monosaccharide ABC transporter ATP-binding protein (CUT2 family) [Halanaerobium saccharolyticum]|uniref:Monosaccharide ABC transporter ATP-binding protein (CUT2 family) n=1 Tax=Halanaerobium saccharolyticum TaxID=43595 RepID=A0A4R6LRF8_9FIRM|nr:sugar ABC transporter ATP-binding protein [Halanaerobium saccharolyticum]TDO90051.1 monosaccharide ABC transporter ATP-binding protein (CUT2 family) [Halanaerobium saccharolyticum]